MIHTTNVHMVDFRAVKGLTLFTFSALMLFIGWQEGHPACKNWFVRYWHGYLSGMRCKLFAYGPAHATATSSSLASLKSRMEYKE